MLADFTNLPTEIYIIYWTFKVTVQFQTEENGQNETVSHMDISEIKL